MSLQVSDRDEWFPKMDSVPRPDWPAINEWMHASVTPEYRDAVATQITRHWLDRLVTALDNSHSVATSEHFFLVSAADEKRRKQVLDFLENCRTHVLRGLSVGAQKIGTRPQVFLGLTSVDACDAFLVGFESGGEYAEAARTFFSQGAVPLPFCEGNQLSGNARMLASGVADHLLRSLPLPAWIHHGATELFRVNLAGGPFAVLSEQTFAEHERHWNTEIIQDFWSGKSFGSEEWQRLAQSLAEVLFEIVHREVRPDPQTFLRFVSQANRTDAGESAALQYLEVGLGEIASVFLGDGHWSPRPATWKTKEEPV